MPAKIRRARENVKRTAIAVLLLLAACGKEGAPHPPVPIIPKSTSDLTATQRGPEVILRWSFPSVTTAGEKLTNIQRIAIYRNRETLPAGVTRESIATSEQAGHPAEPLPVKLFRNVATITPQQFVKSRERVDAIERAQIPEYSEGTEVVYNDHPVISSDTAPLRYTYSVVTRGEGGVSDLSNLVTIVPVDVAQAPENLQANAKAEGVVLTWGSPSKTLSGANSPVVAGYNVYRLGEGESRLSSPINASPVSGNTYTDLPAYATYRYAVTAVTTFGPPLLESLPATSSPVKFVDLVPPPLPTGVTTLVEETSIRLVWDPVTAPDFAGYNVYRDTRGTKTKLTSTPITDTNFRDTGLTKGWVYAYEVTSVDKSGNESAPARSESVLLPQ